MVYHWLDRNHIMSATALLDDLDLKPRNKRQRTAFVGAPEPVTAEDLRAFNDAGPKTPGPAPLQKLRDRHHAVARCVASGLNRIQVSSITGYGITRIDSLMDDPSFKELVAFYRSAVDAEFVDVHARMATLSADAIAELQERLEDNPAEFSIADLKDVAKTFLDRTGHAPVAKSVSVNVNIGMANRLEEARRRAREAAKLVDAVEVEA